MERIKVIVFTFMMAILLFQRGIKGQGLIQPRPGLIQPMPSDQSPRPLCVSQLALVNYYCARIPPSGPPSSPSAIIFSEDNHHLHGHHHHHHHSHGHGTVAHNATPAERDCCKWLNNVDDECVCDLLVRLPPFLARPVHKYTIIVYETCNVTYSCGGRVRP